MLLDASLGLSFFANYGLWLIYVWLLFGLFIVVVPEEVVMLTIGILISKNLLSFWAYPVAILGSLSGATFSFFLGRYLGRPSIEKYGKWVGIRKSGLERADSWFKRYGKWALVIGYFTPSVRHMTSLSSGILEYDYKHFALYTYIAGPIWVSTAITIGYISATFWLNHYNKTSAYVWYVFGFVAVLWGLFFLFFWYKERKEKKSKNKR